MIITARCDHTLSMKSRNLTHVPPRDRQRRPRGLSVAAGLTLSVIALASACATDLSQARLDAIAACEALRVADCDNLVACLDGKYVNRQACLDDPEAGSAAECVALVDGSPCPLPSHAPALAICIDAAKTRTCDDFCSIAPSGKQTCAVYSCFIACDVPKS